MLTRASPPHHLGAAFHLLSLLSRLSRCVIRIGEGREQQQQEMDPEIADIDLNDPELEKAATKIQATFKGFKSRRQGREDDAATKELGSAATSQPPPAEEPVDETVRSIISSPSCPFLRDDSILRMTGA